MCLQMRFVARIAGLLGSPMVNDGIRGRWMSYLQQMDAGLASQARHRPCAAFPCPHEPSAASILGLRQLLLCSMCMAYRNWLSMR